MPGYMWPVSSQASQYQKLGNWLPVVDRTGTPITDPQGNSLGYVQDNPGIVVALNIKHAVDMIDANPIGFQLPT